MPDAVKPEPELDEYGLGKSLMSHIWAMHGAAVVRSQTNNAVSFNQAVSDSTTLRVLSALLFEKNQERSRIVEEIKSL